MRPTSTTATATALGRAREIVLNQVGNAITAVRRRGTDYFTISVDGNGVVTFTQLDNIWHATRRNDDPQTLTTGERRTC